MGAFPDSRWCVITECKHFLWSVVPTVAQPLPTAKVVPVIDELREAVITRRSMARMVSQIKIVKTYQTHTAPLVRIQAGSIQI